MSKLLSKIVIVLLCLAANFANAQPPQYVFSATGSNNVFPFSSTTNRVQWVFNQNQFAPSLPMGMITKIYFKSLSTHSGATYTNLNISIGTTTLTAMPSGGGVWATGLTNCLSASTYSTGPVTNGGWVAFTLSTPYFYDGVSNFILDVSQTGYVTGFTHQMTTSTGSRRQWGSSSSTTISSSGAGQPELGLDVIPGSPCTKTLALPTTNIASTRATVNWTPITGSFKYEYVIDTTTPGMAITPITATTATSALVTGLYPNKTHYLRVRNYCSAISYSMWDTIAFTTLPPCKIPYGFLATNIDSNSANIQWTQDPNVTGFKLLVDTFRTDPFPTNPNIITMTTNFKALTGLKEGRWHYVHVRAKCVQDDSSGWSLDSFYTPTPCRKPVLSLTHIDANNAIISWPLVATAYSYEYFFGSAQNLPANGTPLKVPALQTPYLQPKTAYSAHVRCMCSDNNVKSASGWSSIDFVTSPPLGVANTANMPFQLEAYPNPVKDVLTIKAIGLKGTANVQITDVKGRVMNTLAIDKDQTSVNVNHYAPGIYILQYTDNETVHNLKFTKD
ncbi:MAG: T9SS type A sorting domain-containing protein [Chitinophagales bacterium]|nr:T9SS type A sorting domain-containing protein [Chitinophagales bacterium]